MLECSAESPYTDRMKNKNNTTHYYVTNTKTSDYGVYSTLEDALLNMDGPEFELKEVTNINGVVSSEMIVEAR
jgi:hypothetical protein